MNRSIRPGRAACGLALVFFATFGALAAPAQEPERKAVAVRHPNLLLNRDEIEQVKAKVREHAWAARLLERVKEKVQKDGSGAYLESAIAYALTGEKPYADAARETLLREARDQLPQYEKLDIKSQPEWGRW